MKCYLENKYCGNPAWVNAKRACRYFISLVNSGHRPIDNKKCYHCCFKCFYVITCCEPRACNRNLHSGGKNMKRRNADTGKMRRPLKRTKITEGMYGKWVDTIYLIYKLFFKSLKVIIHLLTLKLLYRMLKTFKEYGNVWVESTICIHQCQVVTCVQWYQNEKKRIKFTCVSFAQFPGKRTFRIRITFHYYCHRFVLKV